MTPNISKLTLADRKGLATADLAEAWSAAGALVPLKAGQPVANEDGTPTPYLLRTWHAAWGGQPAKSIPARMVMFEGGKLTPVGLSRWMKATA